jgi:hypothetical protein
MRRERRPAAMLVTLGVDAILFSYARFVIRSEVRARPCQHDTQLEAIDLPHPRDMAAPAESVWQSSLDAPNHAEEPAHRHNAAR